jgi:hypothetical protein
MELRQMNQELLASSRSPRDRMRVRRHGREIAECTSWAARRLTAGVWPSALSSMAPSTPPSALSSGSVIPNARHPPPTEKLQCLAYSTDVAYSHHVGRCHAPAAGVAIVVKVLLDKMRIS